MKSFKHLKVVVSILMIAVIIFISSCVFIITNLIYIETNKKEKENLLNSQVDRVASIVSYKINNVVDIAKNMSDIINSMNSYDENVVFSQIDKKLSNEKLLFGSGIWFQPYMYDKNEKYYGPYIYRNDNNNPQLTFEYSTPTYDYFNQEWYTSSFNQNRKEIYYSKTFYDNVLNTYFITGTSPIIKNNRIIAVATADVSLRGITDYVDNITVEKEGHAYILTDNGFLMDNPAFPKAVMLNEALDKKYESFIKKASSKANGLVELDDIQQIASYTNIGETGLKLVLIYPRNEIYSSLYKASIYFFILSVFSMIFIFIFSMCVYRLIRTANPKASGHRTGNIRTVIRVHTDTLSVILN